MTENRREFMQNYAEALKKSQPDYDRIKLQEEVQDKKLLVDFAKKILTDNATAELKQTKPDPITEEGKELIRKELGQFCKETWDEAERKEAAAATATKPKRKRHHNQHTKTKQLRLDSMTRVNPKFRVHSFGCWKNPREVYSVRVDKGLAKVFTPVAKAKYGSTCNAIESFMLAVVTAAKTEEMSGRVYPSITVDIGEIKIERNLRERRKLTKTVEYETEVTETLTKCGFVGCNNEATAKGFYKPKNSEVPLCEKHLKLICDGNSLDWRLF